MGSGFRTFQSGEVLTAANVQNFLMEQSVMVFAGTAALGSAIGTAVEPGMVAYLTDADQLIHYVADAAQGTAWQALPMNGAPRNVVINGAMQVAQRGTSTSSITNTGYYTADRFATTVGSLGTWTQSVENDAPTGSGLRKSLKMLCTTADATPAAGDLLIVGQAFEGQNNQQFLKGTASAKQAALTFWVKSNVTGTYIVELFDNDNNRAVSASYTVSASATWEKKTITFPADTTGSITNDNTSGLTMQWWLGAGTTYTSGTLATTWASTTNANRAVGQTNLAAATNNYWQITGVQLEAGAVATPFEFEDISTTIAKCQRYYEKSYLIDVAPGTDTGVGMALAYTASSVNNVGNAVYFRVSKRATPTITAYSKTGTAGQFSNAIFPSSGSVNAPVIDSTGENSFFFYNTTTVATQMAIHWVAAIEL